MNRNPSPALTLVLLGALVAPVGAARADQAPPATAPRTSSAAPTHGYADWECMLVGTLLLLPILLCIRTTLRLRRELQQRTAELADQGARLQACLEADEQPEPAVAEGAAHFRAFFEQAAVGVAQIETASGLIVRINPRLCEILGLTIAEAVTRDCKTLTHPDDLPANWVEMQRLLHGETRRYCLDQRYVRPDGSTIWVALEVSALWEPDAIPDYHLAVVQDISARKATEFALRRAQVDAERLLAEADQSRRALLSLIEDQERATQALRASEDRYRVLFEGSQVPMFLLDPADGTLVDANAAALAYYGYTREAMLALKVYEINQLPRAAVAQGINRAIAGEQNAFAFPHRLASGEIRQVEVHTGPIVVGGRTLLYSVVHDITERQRAAEGLERERGRLAEQLAACGAGLSTTRDLLEQGQVAAALDTLRRAERPLA